MKKRNKKKVNKNTPSNEVSYISSQYDNVKTKGNKKQSKLNKVSQTDASSSSNPVIPIRLKDMNFVPYKELFPNKMKKGTEIVAALKWYDFSKKEKAKSENKEEEEDDFFSEEEAPVVPKVSSKKHLFKKFKGGKMPKGTFRATKMKGFSIARDPVFHLRPGDEPPNDLWWPLVPGIDAPLEDSCEVIGNLNKPHPRDPEEEAKLDKMPTPTPNDIYEQFMTKRPLIRMPSEREWKPGELEEVMRTRTTMADLKHFYETGELIVRE